MKKTLVSALTTALVVGAASTTFAAANPFEDVPADHWAYDAIAQLAADGVIEGYGDGTYRGDQEITRYEMAQMIARAMAKGGGDKALIDKLAAEFADELNNLGVRVAALEKKVDNVKWGGKVRYRFIKRTRENKDDIFGSDGKQKGKLANNVENKNTNELKLRFEPEMIINDHWKGKARLDYTGSMDDAANVNTVTVERMWVTGTYNNFKIDLGKLPYKTQADYGMIMDKNISGGSLVLGKDIKVALNLARINDSDNKVVTFGGQNAGTMNGTSVIGDTTSTYGGIEVYSDRKNKFTWGIGWHRIGNRSLENGVADLLSTAIKDADKKVIGYEDMAGIGRDNYNIGAIGLGYKFTKDLELTAAYSKAFGIDENDAMKGRMTWNGAQTQSYAFQLNYAGADAKKPGSWGAFIAWRQLGAFSSTGWNTYRLNGAQNSGERGFEIGVSWAPMKNVTGVVRWFTGKEMERIDGDKMDFKTQAIFTEWNFMF